MMFCKVCGAEIEENSAFCPVCGAELTANESNNGYQAAENQFYDNFQPAPVVKKKKSKAPIIIVAVVAVIAAVVGVLFATGTFDKALEKAGIKEAPAKEIFDAVKQTVFESQSLTAEVTDGYDNGFAQISFGKDLEGLKVYIEENGTGMYGIYDGVAYAYQDGTQNIKENLLPDVEGAADTLDVEGADEIDGLFNGKLNEEAVKDIYNVGLRDGVENAMKFMYLQSLSEEEMMKYYKQTDVGYTLDYDAIPVSVELPDYDALMGAVEDFLTKGLSEDAIIFEKNEDGYDFTIDADEFLECLAAFVEENETMKALIKAYYEISKIVDTLEGETAGEIDVQQELEMLADECREENIKIECKATIKDGYLTALKIEYDGEFLEIKISDIGSTTIDKAKIDAIDTVDPYAESYDDYYGGYYDDYYYY